MLNHVKSTINGQCSIARCDSHYQRLSWVWFSDVRKPYTGRPVEWDSNAQAIHPSSRLAQPSGAKHLNQSDLIRWFILRYQLVTINWTNWIPLVHFTLMMTQTYSNHSLGGAPTIERWKFWQAMSKPWRDWQASTSTGAGISGWGTSTPSVRMYLSRIYADHQKRHIWNKIKHMIFVSVCQGIRIWDVFCPSEPAWRWFSKIWARMTNKSSSIIKLIIVNHSQSQSFR